eukprot:SAG22_NODE_337_length_12043_cov_58.339556_14_plen_172_part_00
MLLKAVITAFPCVSLPFLAVPLLSQPTVAISGGGSGRPTGAGAAELASNVTIRRRGPSPAAAAAAAAATGVSPLTTSGGGHAEAAAASGGSGGGAVAAAVGEQPSVSADGKFVDGVAVPKGLRGLPADIIRAARRKQQAASRKDAEVKANDHSVRCSAADPPSPFRLDSAA